MKRNAEQNFNVQCDEIKNKIIDRLYAHARILRSGAAFLNADENVTREEWRIYNKIQRIEQQLPGIQGIGFSLLIPRAELPRHIQEIRSEGFPEYKVTPAGDRELYSSIIYLEPFSGRNLRAFGYDMLYEPVRRAAMEQARDKDMATLSGKVILVQETGEDIQAGTLMYVPVYHKDRPFESVEQRRAAIYGWVYSPYRMNDLFWGILGGRNLEKEQQLRLQVFDGTYPSPQSLLYTSQPAENIPSQSKEHFDRQISINFNGHLWTLCFTQLSGGFFTPQFALVWLTAVCGTCITLLLFALFRVLLNTRIKAERIAKELTIELRESEFRWHFAIEGSGDGLWDWNVPESTVFFSPRWKAMLGFADDEVGSSLDEWSKRVYPDDLARVMTEVQAHLDGHTATYASEHRVLSKDGTWKWILDCGLVVSRDDTGKALRVIGTHKDISERKQAEEELQKSEELFRSTISDLLVGVVVHAADSSVLVSNSQASHILGLNKEQMIGKQAVDPAWHFVHEDLSVMKVENYPVSRVISTGKGIANQTLGIKRPDREEITWVSLSAVPVFSDKKVLSRIITNFMDITKRRQAEHEKERLLAAINQAAETVVMTDPEGTIVYVNPAFEQITGYTREEAVGQNPRVLKSGVHDTAFYEALWKTIAAGGIWRGRLVNRKKDGSLYTEEATISPVKDAIGKVVNYVAVKRDVTEALMMEDQVRQSQKMQSLGQLVGGVAHDFNNLLQIINGYTKIAQATMDPNHAAVASLEEVSKAGTHAKDLVGQLLAFSRRQVIDPVDIDLNKEIEDMLKMLGLLLGAHIQIQFIAGKGVAPVFVDKGQFRQVMMNICLNAHDAMPDGGTLTIETKDVLIAPEDLDACGLIRPGRYVCLSITDTGCGMDKKLCEKIFEPFFTTKEVGKGTGLGLSTVYGIVKQNDGHIAVYSEPGKGTVFTIYLPVSCPIPAGVINSISKNSVSYEGGVETILVTDDEETLLKLATHVLNGAGYTVLTAKDGKDAVRVFEEHADEIDLVMMDVVMPCMGGREAMDEILKKRPTMRHLFVSGYSPNAGHTGFIKQKGLNFLSKPYPAEALLQKIRDVLDDGRS